MTIWDLVCGWMHYPYLKFKRLALFYCVEIIGSYPRSSQRTEVWFPGKSHGCSNYDYEEVETQPKLRHNKPSYNQTQLIPISLAHSSL